MAQYKVPDPDKDEVCPYDKSHVFPAKRMQYHLMKCRKNHKGSVFATCPFNARHEMPKPELRFHLENCPDKAVIEPMLAHESSKRNGEDASMFRGCTDLPVYDNVVINSEENWDDEIPSVARIGVDPQFFARQDHMIIPGLTKSEKKEFAKQMYLPAEDRRYLSHNIETEQPLKDEQSKLRLPKTAAQTYLSNQNKSFQQPSAVFAYSLSMTGVGRGLPDNGTSREENKRPGRSRGRGHGSIKAVGRGTTIAETNRNMPLGKGFNHNNSGPFSTVQKGTPAAVGLEGLKTTPEFSVGVGRGNRASYGMSSPFSSVIAAMPQQNKNAEKDLESDYSVKDGDKKLRRIEKKLRQIQLLEDKMEEGYTLTKEEAAKVGMKRSLTAERDQLQQENESRKI
ncbi:uncharacterized protein LOC133175762 [Saccostrea echinata]|uniref:uncharacterized protein LOC133175762 n=1 Tax=Saccostrea echinata TaxID=191078 RepID=UPI002A80AF77|nr:uncharacterized protein LOC133175762 [Saccostrea echinata]